MEANSSAVSLQRSTKNGFLLQQMFGIISSKQGFKGYLL